MNRRDLLKAVIAVMPATSVRVEPPIAPKDLVVIETPHQLSEDECQRLRESIRACWMTPDQVRAREDMPRVIILEDGLKLRIERGIAKVEAS